MRMKYLLLALSLLIGSAIAYVILGANDTEAPRAKPKTEYKLGERLARQNAQAAAAGYEPLEWEALVPKDWDPTGAIKQLDLSNLQDEDPRAVAAMKTLRESWDNAPVNAALDGKRVRIAGYLVPLEADIDEIREFLLVPYFGACIHTPPPPANQTIHVVVSQALKGKQVMDPVWVDGSLKTVRSRAEVGMGIGVSGYRIDADKVEAYAP